MGKNEKAMLNDDSTSTWLREIVVPQRGYLKFGWTSATKKPKQWAKAASGRVDHVDQVVLNI